MTGIHGKDDQGREILRGEWGRRGEEGRRGGAGMRKDGSGKPSKLSFSFENLVSLHGFFAGNCSHFTRVDIVCCLLQDCW
jgi:hypothetical protein